MTKIVSPKKKFIVIEYNIYYNYDIIQSITKLERIYNNNGKIISNCSNNNIYLFYYFG